MKVSDMLKRTTALVFFSFLSSVAEGESFQGSDPPYEGPPFLLSNFKEICLENLDIVTCHFLDSLRYKIIDSGSPQKIEYSPDNRTRETSEVTSGEVPSVGPGNNLRKRFTVFRRKNPTGRGYKRGPGFRSWGGKRDLLLSERNLEKKSKFASWGGKRDGELFPDEEEGIPEKRPKFQNWGGKKRTDDFQGEPEKRWPTWKGRRFYLSEPFKKHVPKRPQFQSWGGKRGSDPWGDFFFFSHPPSRFTLVGGEKRKFSSWGGKRFDDEIQPGENFKGRVFQNWGGKRNIGVDPREVSQGKTPRETNKGEPHFEVGEEDNRR